MINKNWMIYGANGFTGELIARESKKRGLKPILAGRNTATISSIANELGFSYKIFSLDKSEDIVTNLQDIHTVLNCAGPFSQTSHALIEACLETHTHYLDITGEIDVFELLNTYTTAAIQHQIVILPGTGFDVVPTDCLSLKLKKSLSDALYLTLAFYSQGGSSIGTTKTSIEGIKAGARIRKDGKLTKIPFGSKTKEIPFTTTKSRLAVAIPWGDVSTAYYSTGIPNIEVYMSMHPQNIKNMKRLRYIRPLLTTSFMQSYLKRRQEKTTVNPSAETLSKTKSYIYGEVRNSKGESHALEMVTPNGYQLTILTALASVEKVLSGALKPGFYTPAMAFGEDFILQFEGVELKT